MSQSLHVDSVVVSGILTADWMEPAMQDDDHLFDGQPTDRYAAIGSAAVTRCLVVLGDSIVSGWGVPPGCNYPSLIEQRLAQVTGVNRRWRVINAGQPGETVLQGLARYEQDVASHRPEVVLIAFGRNDAALRRTRYDALRERLWRATHSVGMRWWLRLERLAGMVAWPWKQWSGVALSEVPHAARSRVTARYFVGALRKVVQQAQQSGASVVLLTIWPLDAQRLSLAQAHAYAQYSALIEKVARETGALLLEQPYTEVYAPARFFLDDGLHLSATGQAWLAEAILERLDAYHVINLEQEPCDH